MWDFAACKKIFLCWIPPCVIETLPPPIQTPPVATEERRRKQEAESEEDRGFGFFLPSLRRKCLCSSAAFRSDRGNSCVRRQNFPIENKSYGTIKDFVQTSKKGFLRLKRGGGRRRMGSVLDAKVAISSRWNPWPWKHFFARISSRNPIERTPSDSSSCKQLAKSSMKK